MLFTQSYNKLQDMMQAGSLLGTVGTSAGVFSIRLGGAVANFIFSILIARYLAPEDVGFVFLAMSLAMLASLFTTLNMDNGAVRHLLHPFTKGDKAEAAGFIHFTRKMLLLTSPVVMLLFALALITSQHLKGNLTGPHFWGIIATSFSVPLLASIRLGSRWGHSLSAILRSMLSHSLFRPLLLCGLTAIYVLGGFPPRLDVFLGFATLACLAAVVCQYFLLRDTFAFTKEHEADTSKSGTWMRTGVYLSVTVLLLEYFQNIVVVASAFGLKDADVAQLNIALRFIGFLGMGLMAVNMAISPPVSKALAEQRVGQAQWMLSMSTHLKFWPTVLVTALVWLLAPFMVGLFGEVYREAAWALRIFALLPLISAFFGPSIMLLNILGRQKDIFRISAVAVALIVLSIPVAGKYYGINGAAIAAVATMFFYEWALFQRVSQVTAANASLLKAVFPGLFTGPQKPKTMPVTPPAE
jgi:O-antigen/teichoic acid export membrane protein